jgi:hypothetical protein
MSKSIAVPEDLSNNAAELAARDQVTVEEFVSVLLASQFADREYIETSHSSAGRSSSVR